MTQLAVQAQGTTLAVAAPAPTQLVAALDPPLVLEVAPSRATLAVTLVRAGVLTAPAAQGATGAKGDKGDPGPAGPAGATPIEHSYPVAVASGQTLIPISPPPTDLNGLLLTVNGVAYGPPNRIAVSPVAVSWLGEFALDPSDDIRVIYF